MFYVFPIYPNINLIYIFVNSYVYVIFLNVIIFLFHMCFNVLIYIYLVTPVFNPRVCYVRTYDSVEPYVAKLDVYITCFLS